MLEKLYEKFPIMEKLKEEQVFSVQEIRNGYLGIIEQCDEFFLVEITKQDAKDISDFFLELSEIMTS